MTVNTKYTDSLFEEGFAKKRFLFDIFTSFQKRFWGFSILYLQGLQFHVVICFSRSCKQFCFFVSGTKFSEQHYFLYTYNSKTRLTVLFARKSFKLEFTRIFIIKFFISNTSLKISQKIKGELRNIRERFP